MRNVILVAAAMTCIGCDADKRSEPVSPSKAQSTTWMRVSYETIGGGHGLFRPVTFCELAARTEHVGRFRVRDLVGQYEDDPQHVGHFGGFTYVRLELVDGWTPNVPASLEFRVRGGPAGPDILAHQPVELSVDEDVVVFARPKHPDNRGLRFLSELDMFKLADSKWENGQLSASEADLRTALDDFERSGTCVATFKAGGPAPATQVDETLWEDVLPSSPPPSEFDDE